MKTKQIISLIAASIALVCATVAAPEKSPAGEIAIRKVSFRPNDIEKASRTVIRTQEEWKTWLTKNAPSELENKASEALKVDFEKETILVAAMGMQNTGGFAIQFKETKKEGEVLKAIVKSITPPADGIVTQALTYPVAIVAIPKHKGEVKFVEE